MKLNLPIGTSDFKKVRLQDSYYIDKSLLIKEVIEDDAEVILLPRPRRFGKTLNMSMLRYFFDRDEATENRALFEGLQIYDEPVFELHQGKYPVIFISFKDIKALNFETAIEKIQMLISELFIDHQNSVNFDQLQIEQKDTYNSIKRQTSNLAVLSNSLHLLTNLLYAASKQKPIVLIDEYDTPIHSAYNKKYYDEMILFMSSFLGSVLKYNENLYKCVLTGTLRVSRESIFTGLNNIKIYSLLSTKFNDKFGFTQPEVSKLLEDFGYGHEVEAVRRWYNGYIVGGLDVYNPWSVINYVHSHEDGFKPYWLNTSGNDLIKEIVKDSPYSVQVEIKELLDDKPVIKTINENISFPELKNTENSIYSFLFFSGYLKARLVEHSDEADYYNLAIPNVEVKRLFKDIILNWFEGIIEKDKLSMLLNALTQGNVKLFERLLSDFVVASLSFHLTGSKNVEKVYQAFMLGLLVSLSDRYEVTSEKESGYGRYDLAIVPFDKSKKAIIMEFKTIDAFYEETKDIALDLAMNQIEDRQYAAAIEQRGYSDILKLAIVFDGKRVWVKS